MKNRAAYLSAEKRVKKRLKFYLHLVIYIVVNLFLLVTHLSTAAPDFWPKWPLVGWGIGLLFHGLNIFLFSEKSHIIRQMVEKEMKKDI